MKKLEEIRSQIEMIDKEMAKLFAERMKLIKDEIIPYKKENGYPIYDQSRETFLMIRNGSYIEDDEIRHLYMELFYHELELSKKYQEAHLTAALEKK